MEFGLDRALQELRESTAESAEERRRETPREPYGDWRWMGEQGVLGSSISKDVGGRGRSALETSAVFEGLGRGLGDMGQTFAAAAHLFACCMPIDAFGTEQARTSILPSLVDGSAVAANGMTEIDAGTKTSNLSTVATPKGESFELNGFKSFVSNGPVADWLVTYATTDPGLGYLGQSAFVVDTAQPGFGPTGVFQKVGLVNCKASGIALNGCMVGREYLLGDVNGGAAVFTFSMSWERVCLFSSYLGLSSRLLDLCRASNSGRSGTGSHGARHQAFAHRIVDLYTRLDAARLLLYRAAAGIDAGDVNLTHVGMAKIAVSEACVEISTAVVHLLGGDGYLADSGVGEALADCVPTRTFSGVNEVLKDVIAAELEL